jgi:hypothetical protein
VARLLGQQLQQRKLDVATPLPATAPEWAVAAERTVAAERAARAVWAAPMVLMRREPVWKRAAWIEPPAFVALAVPALLVALVALARFAAFVPVVSPYTSVKHDVLHIIYRYIFDVSEYIMITIYRQEGISHERDRS